MKTLPNNVTIFNATPHPITFWKEGWDEPIEVETDVPINAKPVETLVKTENGVQFVKTNFVGDDTGKTAIGAVPQGVLIVGSIIAAQAYPGQVVAMTPAPGFEWVASAEKRMNPDKFTVF